MKIIALEKEVAQPGGEAQSGVYAAEARRVWQLHLDGIIREIYFRRNTHTAVLILECSSLEEANAHLQTLPLLQAGIISFETAILDPYTGYARLFNSPVGES